MAEWILNYGPISFYLGISRRPVEAAQCLVALDCGKSGYFLRKQQTTDFSGEAWDKCVQRGLSWNFIQWQIRFRSCPLQWLRFNSKINDSLTLKNPTDSADLLVCWGSWKMKRTGGGPVNFVPPNLLCQKANVTSTSHFLARPWSRNWEILSSPLKIRWQNPPKTRVEICGMVKVEIIGHDCKISTRTKHKTC